VIVERYLEALTSHDWSELRDCLASDVVRVGPYNDRYVGAEQYVEFLSDLMPTLPDYSMEVSRVTYLDTRAFAELAEHVGGVRTDECIVFELAQDGRISRVDVFIKTQMRR
jgi:ketosteroid isomerase-like protein